VNLSLALYLAAQEQVRLADLRAGDINQDFTGRLVSFAGVLAMIVLAFVLSENRKRVPWRLVGVGTVIQIVFALLVLKTSLGRAVFARANDAITSLLSFSTQGARFVFGNLVDISVPAGLTVSQPAQMSVVLQPQFWANTGAFIAFNVMPTILFFSALMAALYYVGVMQLLVRGIAWVMRRTMGTSGAETTSVASNIFVGQTEAPLLVKPYLANMTRSELMAVMVAGFATVAGGVMAAYVGMLHSTFPDIAGHLLAASVMGAPASLVMAKIMVPETETPETSGNNKVELPKVDANFVDAISRGTSEGLTLALNVAAMLISFIALIALVNAAVGGIGGWFGAEHLTLERIFGILGAPLAWVLGVPWQDAVVVGGLIGTKTIVNEFVAYQQLAALIDQGALHHGKSVVIATYALCGFANFGSIGIQIGGLSAMCPGRRADIARLGLRAMVCGAIATFQTAAIAAMVL
jgi:concentrative nucleoside transporter, CNT family